MPPGNRRRFGFVVASIVLVAFVTLFLGELMLRLFFSETLPDYYRTDEINLAYNHDPQLGWFPKPLSERRLLEPRPITVRHNSMGFRDREFDPRVKPRIAFVGDSFVWGYEVEQDERFTEKLQARLGDSWEVLNLGVSGYGTDQEYLLVQKYMDTLSPDVVVLVFYSNDFDDNTTNARYFGYYKPYFRLVFEGTNVRLEKHGTPVPRSVNYYYGKHPGLFRHLYLVRAMARLYDVFIEPPVISVEPDPTVYIISAMRDYVEAHGARFLLAIADDLSKELIEPARMMGIDCVYLDNEYRFETDGEHWTPEGHTLVSDMLYEHLKSGGYLKEKP